uniref:Ig-like domain-containing protein n=1 Tax=Pyramimonas obovata TaxID=1411642 RepID=A0A7S0R0A6_9CHLO|mmetsp:Transcript_20926/g.45885  ORF Transcript_20926/g.45885 Transcript_20926/m.45885 type:complete len:521 (+) Transcript_20926:67-1629(+)|eukprot:CAMPEP_0118932260 /NCGR_PEP_ID=MMETSP1169-20130426/9656_1 /TAXON_ID=36882 /ORGANISM="Pyramimonas obovata, Strain CCMP722" /LENGTH=520 /DNA_ID=CAMNT_0006874889 /DNA_START=66 /DNA_END=1628 /DNA_ORIENTATION=+
MRALLFCGIACLLVHSTFAINAVTNDPGATIDYNNADAIGPTPQGANMPALFQTTGVQQGGTAEKRMTKETYAKFYTKCVDASTSGSTYTLSYALDGAPAKVVGSAFTASSNPFILIEGLDVGAHSLVVTCTENAKSNAAKTAPLTDVADSSSLTLNWMVASTAAIDVKFDSATPDVYTNSPTTALSFSADMTYNALYHSIAWTCSVNDADFTACGSINTAATSTTVDQSTADDGKYSFKAKITVTYITDCVATPNTCTDLTPQTGHKGTSWILDRTKPEVVVTSFPAAKSQYTEGKKVKFEFACKSGEVSCSYFCSLDGMNSPDYNDDDKEKGYFACTSPLKLAVKNTTTHSFRVYAVDAAGNPSYASIPSDLPMYKYYSDGTGPTVEFTRMDTTASSATQLLADGSLYYALDNDVTITGTTLTLATGVSAATSIADGALPYTDGNGATGSATTLRNDYHTVFQFDYNPTKAVYELEDGAYGAILSMKAVNGIYYYNVLDTTNADFGTLNFKCIHTEFA